MAKLVLLLDDDGYWKVVHLNDDLSFGYTKYVPIGVFESFGYVCESQATNFRLLAYDTNLEPTPLVRLVRGIPQTLYYYDLAEIIPNPQLANQIPATLAMPPEIFKAAILGWNTLLLQQQIHYLVQNLQLAEARTNAALSQVQFLSNELESASVGSGASRPDLSSATSTSTSPTPLTFSPSTPGAKILKNPESLAQPQETAAIKKAKDLLRQQQLQRNFEIAVAQLIGTQQESDPLIALLEYLQHNLFVIKANAAEVLNLLNAAELPLGVCVACLDKQMRANGKEKKLSDKVLKALLQKLTSYNVSEFKTQNISIPQTVVQLSAQLKKAETKDIIEMQQLHQKLVQLQGQTAPVTKSKPEPVSVTAVVTTQVTPPAAKVLKPIDKLSAAIVQQDAQEFNKVISEKHNTNIYEELALVYLKISHTNPEELYKFLQACNIPYALTVLILKNIEKYPANFQKAFVKRMLELPDMDFIQLLQDCSDNRVVKEYFQIKLPRIPELKKAYDYKNKKARECILNLLAEKVRNNTRGILTDLQRYSLLLNERLADGDTLLMLAIKTRTVSKEVINFLLENAHGDLENLDQYGHNILHLWARHRPNDIAIFSMVFSKYSALITAWHDAVMQQNTKKPEHKHVNVGGELVKKAKDLQGNSFFHLWLNSKPEPTIEAINFIIQTMMDNQSLSVMALFIKNANGETCYSKLESRILGANPRTFQHEFAQLEGTLFYIIDSVRDMFTETQKPNYSEETLDFFNNKGNGVFRQLLEKLPNPKDAERLKVIVQFRNRLRGNIKKMGMLLQPYFGIHDVFDITLQMLLTDSSEANQQKVAYYIKSWIELEYAAAEDIGSLLYVTLYAISFIAANTSKNKEYCAAMLVLNNIVACELPVLEKLLQFTDIEGQNCLYNLFYWIAGSKEDDRPLQILRKMLSLEVNILNRNIYGNNFMHAVAAAYAAGVITNKTLVVIKESIKPEYIQELLNQRNRLDKIDSGVAAQYDGVTPIEFIKSPDKRNAFAEFFAVKHSLRLP